MKTMRNYLDYIKTPYDFGAFITYEFGFDEYIGKYLIGYIILPLYIKFFDHDMVAKQLCTMMYYD